MKKVDLKRRNQKILYKKIKSFNTHYQILQEKREINKRRLEKFQLVRFTEKILISSKLKMIDLKNNCMKMMKVRLKKIKFHLQRNQREMIQIIIAILPKEIKIRKQLY